MAAISTVHWSKYLDWENKPHLKRFVESRGNDVFWQVAIHSKKAYLSDKKSLNMIVHENAPAAIRIEFDEYFDVLKLCMKWFLSKEDYEKCHKIQTFINQMLSKKNKTTKKEKVVNLI